MTISFPSTLKRCGCWSDTHSVNFIISPNLGSAVPTTYGWARGLMNAGRNETRSTPFLPITAFGTIVMRQCAGKKYRPCGGRHSVSIWNQTRFHSNVEGAVLGEPVVM